MPIALRDRILRRLLDGQSNQSDSMTSERFMGRILSPTQQGRGVSLIEAFLASGLAVGG